MLLPSIKKMTYRLSAVLVLLVTCQLNVSFAAEDEDRWSAIKTAFLGEKDVLEGQGVIRLEAPERAYDAALVPITITSTLPQEEDRYISKVHLIVDMNPAPLAGTFTFAPETKWDSFETRIRINEYTNVRAIAELNSGDLYMDTVFIKASGGCSAPAMSDMEAALQRLGRMKMSMLGEPVLGHSTTVQVMVSHPNNSGMQFDQVSRHYIPAHFVHKMGISYDGNEIVHIDTNFSLSENPSIRFSFVPDKYAELSAYAIDSKDNRFEHSWSLDSSTQ